MTSIDVNYDFRDDTKGKGTDPDNFRDGSPTLKRYHKILWSKKLPNGDLFNLSDPLETDEYLWFQTESSPMRLSSDWMINTYLHWDSLKELQKEVQEEYNNFNKLAHTIGNYIIFPLNPEGTPRGIDTINTGRCKLYNCKIKDRFDLTLECIRRYYFKKDNPSYNEENPLYDIIKRFDYYFDLFVNFKEFCDFYFLQDLTENDYKKIKYFLTFKGFSIDPYPKKVEDYREYMKKATEFIDKRNKLIDDYVKTNKL
jgi:hypothetical protein